MAGDKVGDCYLCDSSLYEAEDLEDEFCQECQKWLWEETEKCTKERMSMNVKQMPTNESIELAAQAWCDPTVSDRVMDGDLAIAFARIIDKVRTETRRESSKGA